MKFNKKIFLILTILIIGIKNVNASSYTLDLETTNLNVEKNSKINISIVLKDINDIANGLNVCEASITNTNGIKVDSITGLNSWAITLGDKLLLDSSVGITSNTTIATINATINDTGTITLSNIKCSDGENEYTTANKTLSITVIEEEPSINSTIDDNSNENDKNIETNVEVESSTTIKNPQTGVMSITLIMLMLIIFSFILIKFNKRYNLFKRKI